MVSMTKMDQIVCKKVSSAQQTFESGGGTSNKFFTIASIKLGCFCIFIHCHYSEAWLEPKIRANVLSSNANVR